MNKLRIIVLGYDIKLIDKAVEIIIDKVVKLGIDFSGFIPLPTKKRTVTVLKSPHKHKNSQETFVRNLHRRKLEIRGANSKQLEDLNDTQGIPVNVEIVLENIQKEIN